MSLLNRMFKKRSAGQQVAAVIDWDDIICSGYTKLSDCPEIISGVRTIADLVSSMTIHLMSNTDNGDIRIINELSRKIDINPCKNMTRKTWMDFIVMNLLLYGKGNSVVIPETKKGILENLKPIPASKVSFTGDSYEYRVKIDQKEYKPENILHFVYNSDENYPWKGKGITTSLKGVADNLKQAATTEKDFMSSKWKPSIIVKVDALTEEFASPEGRERLLDSYFKTNKAGQPWLIPADQFQVDQVKPLSLEDLAIDKSIELNKKTVASIIGVPAFVLGVGTYSNDEWNNFISSKIMPIAQIIQQELTKKLLISSKWYWKFNMASLYAYDIKTLSDVYSNLYVRGIVDGNEVRDKLSMSPREGLSELVVLENYIPLSMIGDQSKLKGDNKDE
ncbi:MAG: phage portal protein [Clostridia bacterium]|nr:phage portal protein [Clostridia bacterium]